MVEDAPLGLAHSRCSETLAPDFAPAPRRPCPTFPGPQEAITCRRGAGRRPHLLRRLSAAPSPPRRGARRLRVLPPAAPLAHDPGAAPGTPRAAAVPFPAVLQGPRRRRLSPVWAPRHAGRGLGPRPGRRGAGREAEARASASRSRTRRSRGLGGHEDHSSGALRR